jgi:hypothetical protein
MKKILLTLLVSACAMAMHGQIKKLKYGAILGLQLTDVSGDIENARTKIGFNVGVVVDYAFVRNFSLQPELLLSTQGWKQGFASEGISYTAKIRLDYLNIPVLIKYKNFGFPGLEIGAGPQIGFLLNANSEAKNNANGQLQDNVTDVKNEFKSVDAAAIFSLGYALPMGAFVEARYNLGLTNINNGPLANENAKNSVVSVSVGYTFN